MKIIGISGKKQSGKTTAANYISSRLNIGHDIINFASYLKEIVLTCFGEPDEYGNNIYARNVLGSDEDKNGVLPCGDTARQLLQWLGTDIMRAKDSDCWVKAYTSRVIQSCQSEYPPELTLTADVRFPNEVKCIQDLGGRVIRLLRAPFPDDKHESETALDYGDILGCNPPVFDAIIDNRNMTIDQQNEAVWKLVNERNWI